MTRRPEPDPADAPPVRVLVVDDEESMRHFIGVALRKRGFDAEAAADAKEALAALARKPFDVLVTDIRMPGMDGHELFRKVLEVAPGTKAVLMTAFGTVKDAVAALKLGAETYLTKPFETEELVAAVEKAAEHARLSAENRMLREMLGGGGAFAGLVGAGKAMRRLFKTLEQVARTSGTVLVTGESGSGKELVARALHARSSRRGGPFVAVHCGALPANLVEAELFGVEAGAFTGADRPRAGHVERAAGGTLFLDEITEIPLDVQPSLLRFLEGGEVTRVGGSVPFRPDVRVVAASNKELRLLVEEGKFRADLFYRLDVLPVAVPPLRERLEDIPLLIVHFLANVGRPELLFPPDVVAFLQGLPWPGNVRELHNLVERMASTLASDVVQLEDLPEEVRGGRAAPESFRPYRVALESFEKEYLEGLLERTGGNVSEAARLGGLSRPSLHARIAALGIDTARIRGRRP